MSCFSTKDRSPCSFSDFRAVPGLGWAGVHDLCLSAPPHPVPGAVRKPLLYPYLYALINNYFNIVFHSVLVV